MFKNLRARSFNACIPAILQVDGDTYITLCLLQRYLLWLYRCSRAVILSIDAEVPRVYRVIKVSCIQRAILCFPAANDVVCGSRVTTPFFFVVCLPASIKALKVVSELTAEQIRSPEVRACESGK